MDFVCAGSGGAGGKAKARRRREHTLAHYRIGAAYRHPVLIIRAAVGDGVAAVEPSNIVGLVQIRVVGS